eukprot:1435554-Prymnesium_polylepis.1
MRCAGRQMSHRALPSRKSQVGRGKGREGRRPCLHLMRRAGRQMRHRALPHRVGRRHRRHRRGGGSAGASHSMRRIQYGAFGIHVLRVCAL